MSPLRRLALSFAMILFLAACSEARTPEPVTPAAAEPSPAPTLSGSGGVIVFASLSGADWYLYLTNADGSGQRRLSPGQRTGYEPSWSPDGTQIVFQYDGLWIADAVTGATSPLPLDRSLLENPYLVKPSWSPNGEWIAFINESGTQGDIFLVRPDGTDLRRLTGSDDISRDGNVVWSPDGRQLAFSAIRGGRIEIYLMDIEEALPGTDSAPQRQLTVSSASIQNFVTSWSPDGSRIAFSSNRDGNTELYLMDPDGSNVVRLTENPFTDREPDWSPDGRQIVFSSNRDGNFDVYVLNVDEAIPDPGGVTVRRLTESHGDEMGAVWRPVR
jgi:Tol biopolymer transport system component